ncbi:MAG: helix-turn-helix transcriptional regulator [Candidatus Pedobacter colombiensis]|uniref:Helix-turn-helix transcriptional regulator n=1 Tax=Candidatus Pedobacter colombiensis TaxID=3121371 RepID=A0AAJ6B4F1_9SPHI|nr:helix-turn-helix transcriptional regulator [Pedobacter sp.]WEK17552.1 MAG: helix-turn-helix transcriptional regulator [Pedobacter sp.]
MKRSITIKNKIETAELIRVSPFSKEKRRTQPHKHSNYFEIIYLLKGKGTHTIDYVQYAIETPAIFFVRKEQVHHWDIETSPEGYVLLLQNGFVEKSLDSELKKLLSRASALNCLYLKESCMIEPFFRLLASESDFTVTEGILKALLAKILNNAHLISTDRENKTGNVALLFRELLDNTDELRNNVAYYAEKLNTTPQNLNAISRKALGLSASQLIAQHIISEAKRLLIYTETSVSGIAYSLSFNDTSHFVKYFRRHTGFTPQAFRRER